MINSQISSWETRTAVTPRLTKLQCKSQGRTRISWLVRAFQNAPFYKPALAPLPSPPAPPRNPPQAATARTPGAPAVSQAPHHIPQPISAEPALASTSPAAACASQAVPQPSQGPGWQRRCSSPWRHGETGGSGVSRRRGRARGPRVRLPSRIWAMRG